MIQVILKFDNTLINLAGNQFGRQVFEQQIKEVKYGATYTIVFPENIQYIATSFIQGFFQKFVETIGIIGVEKHVQITSSITNLKDIIIACLV